MSRPKCCRRIDGVPACRIFKPAGVSRSVVEEIVLSMDEFEAIRLADLDGLYHEEAGARMNVSRQTFGRIVEQARRKVARALVGGLSLRIEGGAIDLAEKRIFGCRQCEHRWSVGYGTGRPAACPVCESNNISRTEEERETERVAEGCRHNASRNPE